MFDMMMQESHLCFTYIIVQLGNGNVAMFLCQHRCKINGNCDPMVFVPMYWLSLPIVLELF